ncbi:hypothetical protein LEP1GSC202_0316 [Leptospira yanagawae serovar Saopaulo str. Sao Paulo = ATCC 700523]|uniref:Uncharacterized protein n=1 Tax=Leptospira yanagawae serovar Saopaulo str. Sao Paulo = ATCC 700523 TaxID=1249483 RepID=A0A5E8H9Q1_9LEPT|nr:hypothetical protein [Leptospira yanagawae]EOQ87582.1 hypothetical protein LEP1GSC202_0316 [Leptospira yanagawae serovar Saopaulo str. Sao Paulo = ATCC 700523]
MKLLTIKLFFIAVACTNCITHEILSQGVTSDSELELISFKNFTNNPKIRDEIDIRAFKINNEKNLSEIIYDKNNTFFDGDLPLNLEDLNLKHSDIYMFSINVQKDSNSINLSNFSISSGELPLIKTNAFVYDYIILSKYNNGIAGSMESMSITKDSFPIKPEEAYNHRIKSSSYGYTLVNYLRTIRFIVAFKKEYFPKKIKKLIFRSKFEFEADFTENLD